MPAMITCPWCGTSYAAFQPNCKNCGGPLPPPAKTAPSVESASAFTPAEADLPTPPPPPRPFADNYIWRLLLADGLTIVAGIFALIGGIFALVGVPLTIGIVTAFVGLPFTLIGGAFLAFSVPMLRKRYLAAQTTLRVLREGTAARGRLDAVEQNYNVRVNGRHPWTITYHYNVGGRDYQGKVTTLNPPGPQLQPGYPACVLYLPEAPEHNALYPHP